MILFVAPLSLNFKDIGVIEVIQILLLLIKVVSNQII